MIEANDEEITKLKQVQNKESKEPVQDLSEEKTWDSIWSTHYLILPSCNRAATSKNRTVKPVLVVTSIKQPTCIKQPEESCPEIHIPIYLNCIKQPPAFSSHFLSFPWVAA